MYKRLTKSSERILGGVCGGIADFFELDPTLVRAAYAILTSFSAAFPGIILYVLLCFIMPASEVEQ